MDDFFKRLFDPKKNNKPVEGSEPSFDFYDFKSWLKNNDEKPNKNLKEQVEDNRKEKLREEFHSNVNSKLQGKKRRRSS